MIRYMRVIYCAGEQGRVVLDILRSTGDDDGVVFGDDDSGIHGESVAGRTVVGGANYLSTHEKPVSCVISFGARPGVRLDIADKLTNTCEFFNAIHMSTTISDEASLGSGLILNAGSYIGPGVEIDNHVLIDSRVSVSHDVQIGKGAIITPGSTIAGDAVLSTDSYIAPGATITRDVTVGKRAVVGAGAVVIDDVPPGTTVVGVPASPLEE
jgi:UDP-perosamine 4-acetyltransferase